MPFPGLFEAIYKSHLALEQLRLIILTLQNNLAVAGCGEMMFSEPCCNRQTFRSLEMQL